MKFENSSIYRMYSVNYKGQFYQNLLAQNEQDAKRKTILQLAEKNQVNWEAIKITPTGQEIPSGVYRVTKEMLQKLLHYQPSDEEILGHWVAND